MKAKNLIIVLLFIACFSFSQVKDTLKGWYFGPNFSFLSAVGHYYKPDGFSNYVSVNKNNNYYSYSVGIDAMYAFGRKHTLVFGLHYEEARSSYNDYPDANPIWNPQGVSNICGRHVENWLLLPVHMDFCLLKGKISPYIMTGLSPNFFLDAKSYVRTTYTNGKVEEMSGRRYQYQKFDVTWQIGFGVDLNLKKSKIRLFFYDSGSEPIYFNSMFGWKYWRYSLKTGISYYFKTSRR
ncbi:MAG: outer membrane beta-barrel protein [Bacteroidia bacterium]|nr:outer membrane beta-barrel protein [Bacteroidia bacterium]